MTEREGFVSTPAWRVTAGTAPSDLWLLGRPPTRRVPDDVRHMHTAVCPRCGSSVGIVGIGARRSLRSLVSRHEEGSSHQDEEHDTGRY